MKNIETILRLTFAACFMMLSITTKAQNVNVEDLLKLNQKKKFKVNGGFNATSTSFDTNESSGRQPFTYQLNGNINLSIYELLNIPVTFNFNNFGANMSYPSLPNRFSIHPSYKWIRVHIGDVAMSFSPYTLNGHLFTGGGVELTPGKWAIAAMGGRLMRRIDFNPTIPNVLPSFNRYGYGLKTRYNGDKFFLGGSIFSAKDQFEIASFETDSMGVFPKSNVVGGIEAGLSIIPNLVLAGEGAISLLTRDIRSANHEKWIVEKILNRRESSNTYLAAKLSLNYMFRKNTIGLGYEYISPQYQTLGAYYFNSDFENYTLNYARPFWGDKVNIALSGGLQRDDLDNSKESRNTRIVGSANVTITPGERLNMTASASTFQGHRVIKSQFDFINQNTPYENLDTLDFRQISQNVDFNLSWITRRCEITNQNMNIFISYQEAADKQGEYIRPGNLTRFINASTIYSVEVKAINTNFSAGFNISNNYSNMTNFLTLGPLMGVNVKLLKKHLITGATFAYNRSQRESTLAAEVTNFRWNANYRFFKRHTLQADMMFQKRNIFSQSVARKVHSLTAQLGYSYSF